MVFEGPISPTKKKINKLVEEVQGQNKQIKLSDRSPTGWAAIQKYLSNDFASVSEDENQMRATEKEI